MSLEKEKKKLIRTFLDYRDGRKRLLKAIQREQSNRDPMSEFAEKIASVILDAKRNENPVQKGYDMIDKNGKRIDVKFLSNPKDSWVNWHELYMSNYKDQEALVYYEDIVPQYMFVFDLEKIGELTIALGKRHKNRDISLQFTKTDYQKLSTNPERYQEYGVRVYNLKE